MKHKIAAQLLDDLMHEMNPASVIIDALHNQGYKFNFRLVDGALLCIQNELFYELKELCVDQIYRFEDESKAMGSFYIYALRDNWSGVKGLYSCGDALNTTLDI